jgi:hypothetical protein
MIFPQSALLLIWNLGNRYSSGITAVCQSMKIFNLWSHPCCAASYSACKVRSKLVSISLTHFPWLVLSRRPEYIQESQQKIILQVYSFVSRPNYPTLTVIMWGEFVAERLSSLSSSWRHGWSWEGDICNKMADNTGHGRLSKRNWKARPTIGQMPRLLCDIYSKMRGGR